MTNLSKCLADVCKCLRLSCPNLTDAQSESSGDLDARGRTPRSGLGAKALSEHHSEIPGEPIKQIFVGFYARSAVRQCVDALSRIRRGHRLFHGPPNPPPGVRREAAAPIWIETVDGLDETNRAGLDRVEEARSVQTE